MSGATHTPGDRDQSREEQATNSRKNPPHAEEGTVPNLQLTTVKYNERPNRGTIHPPNLTGIRQMETWISVDMSMVAELSMWR